MRLDRQWLLPIGMAIGFVVARVAWAVPARALVVLLVGSLGVLSIRFVLERLLKERARPSGGRIAPVTRSPARCSHCGVRRDVRVRMVAGRNAYICELCLRRGIELLDAPDDITRFL